MPAFTTNSGRRAVTVVHDCIVAEREDLRSNRFEEHRPRAAREIRAADGTGEQQIADKHHVFDVQTYAARRMARRIENVQAQTANLDCIAFFDKLVGFRRRVNRTAGKTCSYPSCPPTLVSSIDFVVPRHLCL